MQAPLAIEGFLLGLAAWWQTGHVGWIRGAEEALGCLIPHSRWVQLKGMEASRG